jgi:hypothetical protein
MRFYAPGVLTGGAKRHGISVLPPDVNRSGVRCTVESDAAVRLGLSSVRGVAVVAAAALVAARRGGPFRALFDFTGRTGLHRAGIENLSLAGAFDGFGLGRWQLLWQLGLFAGVERRRRPSAGVLAIHASPRAAASLARRGSVHQPTSGAAAARRMGTGRRPGGVPPAPGDDEGGGLLSLEDEFGLTNVVVHPGCLATSG